MKDNKKIGFIVFALSVGIALLVGGCSVIESFNGNAEPTASIPTAVTADRVISEGNLMPEKFLYLAFPTGGRVEEILVDKGAEVSEGDVLVRLGDREQAQASLSGALLELESAGQALDDLNINAELTGAQVWQDLIQAVEAANAAQVAWDALDTDEFQEDIDDAQQAVVDAQKEVDDAQEELDKYADFSEDNPTRERYQEELDEAQDNLNEAIRARDQIVNQRDMAHANLLAAQARLEKVQVDYDATRDGPDPDQLRLAEMRLENAQSQVSAAHMALDHMDLKAPFSGTVVDINVRVNELVGTDTWVVLIADYSQWYVETNDLTELEVVDIEVGDTVSLMPDALPELSLTGEVTEISDMFTTQAGDILYEVRILVEENDPRMRWGMTVEIDF